MLECYTPSRNLKPFSDPAFLDLLGPGGLLKPPPTVILKLLTLSPPNLHRKVYALILITTDTVINLVPRVSLLCLTVYNDLYLPNWLSSSPRFVCKIYYSDILG